MTCNPHHRMGAAWASPARTRADTDRGWMRAPGAGARGEGGGGLRRRLPRPRLCAECTPARRKSWWVKGGAGRHAGGGRGTKSTRGGERKDAGGPDRSGRGRGMRRGCAAHHSRPPADAPIPYRAFAPPSLPSICHFASPQQPHYIPAPQKT
jgi:hypothetical protein